MFKITRKFLLLFLVAVLCVFAGNAGAEDELLWPIEQDLLCKDWSNIEPQTWVKVGDVKIWNTRGDLKIEIIPITDSNGYPFKLKEVNIFVSLNDQEDFEAILNKKGKPIPGKFNYKTDYPDLEDKHVETLPFHSGPEFLDICWSVDPEKCPNNRYIIVHAELVRWDEERGSYENIGEGAFATGDKDFSGSIKGDLVGDGLEWGWYNTYPVAKVETGHFVDAKVKGLTYTTPTQDGTSGDSGDFFYIPDERADFQVGNVYLGKALADHNVTPYDLSFEEDVAVSDDQALNVAWLLQNLDSDGNVSFGPIWITDPVIACLNNSLPGNDPGDFSDEGAVGTLIASVQACCAGLDPEIPLTAVTREQALANLGKGQKAENIVKKNISKTPGMKSDKAKIDIMPVYVPSQKSDGTPIEVSYYDADGNIIETRDVAKPIIVSYLDEVEGTGAADVFVAVSRDDGDTWKRRNISKTADKSSKVGYPGVSQKPMLKVKDNMIFVAWTDKFCRGGRPGYAITVCPDTNGDGEPDPCEICRETDEGTKCTIDYPGDDAYYQDDLFGAGGPQRSVIYDDYPEMGEVAFSCVWTARGVIDPATGGIQWFKPERLTSGRRDAFQLFAGAGTSAGFAIVWQEDPKGLVPGEGDGPGDGWSGANSNNKTDVWYSFITLSDFAEVDYDYPAGGHGDNDDIVDTDPELAGRVKAMVPMSLPVKISDNDVCSFENMDPDGGNGEHDFDGEGQGTHRYCGDIEGIGTAELPGDNELCAYTIEKANPKGEIHNVCVTADGRLLDGNTGASRPNIFLQPYTKTLSDGSKVKSAWAIIGYEESKGVGTPPDGEHDVDECGGEDGTAIIVHSEDPEAEDRYKPDVGKNVIYHSFDFTNPEVVGGGGMINLPETDAAGTIYLVDEEGELLRDWNNQLIPATENARRVRFVTQPKSKIDKSMHRTALVALYRQGEEGSGKPADIFMRRAVAPSSGNPYAFGNFLPGAQNLSSVSADPDYLFQDPFDPEKPEKMLRWNWTPANLADKSGTNPRDDARAHRGSLNGDELLIGYSWTPNWGRKANDKYDFLIRRSFNGGQAWTTDPADSEPIEHNVVFRVPVIDEVNQEVTWDEEVVTTPYNAGVLEPPRNVSNLRNNRISVLEPRLVKTPGTITSSYPEDVQDTSVFQLVYGLEFNQNQLPDNVFYPKIPLDINYSRTKDKGQRYESVIVTPQGGSGKPQQGWNPLAKDKPEQGAAQLRQTPDGSRMYGIWLEESDDKGSDIMFRRIDYR
jgi:hypothetical protein